MGYQWANAKPGVGRPVPNFAHPLWRGCLFATSVGSSRGHIQQAQPAGDINDRFGNVNVRSRIFTTGGFNPNGVNWQGWSMGRGYDNGDGVNSLNPQGWVETGGRYDLDANQGATWAVIVRPDAQTADPLVPIFKRRAQPYAAAQLGWHFSGAAGNFYRFEMSDGVTNRNRTSTTVQSGAPNTRSDLLIARYYWISATNGRLELWVNGIGEAGLNLSFAWQAVGNPAEPIKILGYDPLDQTFPGFIPFAAMWNRPLANSELAGLYTDPFIMWRWLQGGELFAPAKTIAKAPDLAGARLSRLAADVGGVRLAAQPVVFSDFAGGGSAGDCCCCPSAALLF